MDLYEDEAFEDGQDEDVEDQDQDQDQDVSIEQNGDMDLDDVDNLESDMIDDGNDAENDNGHDGESDQDETGTVPNDQSRDKDNYQAADQELLAGTYKSRFPIQPDEVLAMAQSYDVVPTTAFIHGGAVYSMALTWGSKYLFTGGEDGYIRRFDFFDSMGGKQLLSMGQRTSVDSIVNGGVLLSYWENEQPLPEAEYKFEADDTYTPKLSPVYSMAVQSEGLWLCTGLEGGGINVQTIRYGEGRTQSYLDAHTSTVSELQLNGAETHLLSGSWDKSIMYWDLETGDPIRSYSNLHGQVSSLVWQPLGGPVVNANDDDKSMNSLFGSDEEDAKDDVEAGESKPEPKNTGNIFLSTTLSGSIEIWDVRSPTRCMVLHNPSTPPWSMSACWSVDGSHAFVGRRNSTVDEFDIRSASSPSRVLKFPPISGAVTALSALPNGRHIICGSLDNVRLYDLKADQKKTPFYIVAGYHGALLSRMTIDPSSRYLITASGGRGWEEGSAEVVLGYEINIDSDEEGRNVE